MAIVKEIDGKKKVIADQSVVDHSQLTGTQAYGAHPISAIRKLPEKLHALKEADKELSDRITAHDEEVDAIVEKVNSDGSIKYNQWVKSNNKWYYITDQGTYVRNGIYKVGTTDVTFDADGVANI